MSLNDLNLSETLSDVNPSPLAVSLVNIYLTSYIVSPCLTSLYFFSLIPKWLFNQSRQRKRLRQRLISWQLECLGRCLKLSRVDLTTGPDSDREKLSEHLELLLRMVKRRFGYDVEYFTIETDEGGGLYHMVWACNGKRFWIPQRWLSAAWKRVHGSPIVYIKEHRGMKGDCERIASYIIAHYMREQAELIRFNWSWKKSRVRLASGWSSFKRIVKGSSYAVYRNRLYSLWADLLREGHCRLGNLWIFLSGKDLDYIDEGWAYVGKEGR